MKTSTGLDKLVSKDFESLHGLSVGLVCNQATISSDLRHIIEIFLGARRDSKLKIQAVFGPQHGLWGHTQDNMIEWEGSNQSHFPFPIYSLYGQHREPTDEMLAGIEAMVIDLPDIGSRYYTFIWTTALCLKACERASIPVVILDRPNPINGTTVEGTVLDQEYSSFVGLYPLPIRHGMTLGEIATYLKHRFFQNVDLKVERVEGWAREQYLDQTGLTWAMPSPNIPTLDSALVYPGGCLLEGTTLSEGRGTTRPFEILGAPYMGAMQFSSHLNSLGLGGVYFRPYQFEPTFQKYAKSICEGIYIHVTERAEFKPFLTYVAIIKETLALYDDKFGWSQPPYEYEYIKLPFDILAGNSWLRAALERQEDLSSIEARLDAEVSEFLLQRSAALLY